MLSRTLCKIGDAVSNPFGRKEEKFPTTLEGFNYRFDEHGKLRNILTGEGYNFNVREGDRAFNQEYYEALGEVITEYVYTLLETDTGLERHYLPVDYNDKEPKTFFFMSPGALANPDKLMILIHGTGAVRAGQWGRKLIINDCLDTGTQLPYIKRALSQGYGVVVLNTNDNYREIGKKEVKIRGNEYPETHAVYVYDKFLQKAKAQHIAIVAHSFGGVVTVNLINERPDMVEKLFAVAFTDSVHSMMRSSITSKTVNCIKKDAINWVSSDKPLDTPMPSRSARDCQALSAGTDRHDFTSASAIDSIFKFFEDKLPGNKQEKMDEL